MYSTAQIFSFLTLSSMFFIFLLWLWFGDQDLYCMLGAFKLDLKRFAVSENHGMA